MTKSYFNIREALEVGTDKIVDAYKKATPGEVNELSAEEKKLVNQMYDKKGNLTPLGKKVMNHGKKPGDKGYVENTNEEVEQVDEISRSMTPMRNKFGGTVIPKKFDAYKKFVKKNNVDEPTVRMIHDNPDAAESKRMMKNPKIAQAVDLYKAAHMKKESVEEAKVECPKCKGEGCDHCDGKGYHMTEAKQKNWIVTVVKPINKLKKGMKVIVPARNTAEAMKKALKKMGENPAAIGSGHIDVKLDEELEEKYRAPTKAEIEADKKKDQKGKSRPSISAKSVNKKQYGNMMGRLKEEELDEMNPYKNHPKNKLKAKQASFNRQIGDLQTKKLKGAKNPSIDQEIAKYQQKLRQVKSAMESRFGGLEEKLQVSDGMAKWIEDFQKSDAPQFVEKDKNERREMAIAAYLAAKRKSKKED